MGSKNCRCWSGYKLRSDLSGAAVTRGSSGCKHQSNKAPGLSYSTGIYATKRPSDKDVTVRSILRVPQRPFSLSVFPIFLASLSLSLADMLTLSSLLLGTVREISG